MPIEERKHNQIPLTQAQKNLVEHIESAVKKNKDSTISIFGTEITTDRQERVLEPKIEELEDALATCIRQSMHRIKRLKVATELQVMKRLSSGS